MYNAYLPYIKLTYPSLVGKREFLATVLITGTSFPSIKKSKSCTLKLKLHKQNINH